jgi:hypothetical protein
LLEAPVDVELAVEAREALHALAGLRWRRRRMLVLRAAGYSYKEIAEMLSVTYTNVNGHVTGGGRSCGSCARRREESVRSAADPTGSEWRSAMFADLAAAATRGCRIKPSRKSRGALAERQAEQPCTATSRRTTCA